MSATTAQSIALVLGLIFLLGAMVMTVILVLANKRDKVASAALPTAPAAEVSSGPSAVFDETEEPLPSGRAARRTAGAAASASQPLSRRSMRGQAASTEQVVAPATPSRAFFEDDDDIDFDSEWSQGSARQ